MLRSARIVITDSGLGGLSICAALEQGLRRSAPVRRIRLTYVNAWPFEDRGYNDLPDEQARARVFDAALARMAGMGPDRILIACNTLSILYPSTAYSLRPAVPVQGIVDAGVDLFADHLAGDPGASIVLIGTRTTIESGAHKTRLEQRGVDPRRVAAVSCHGLAGVIEHDVDGARAAALIGECAAQAAGAAPPGGVLLIGLCCTHYGYVAERLAASVARMSSRSVQALNPNLRLTAGLLADPAFIGDAGQVQAVGAAAHAAAGGGMVSVELISKVSLSEIARAGIARLVAPVSPAAASALLSYAHVPDLF